MSTASPPTSKDLADLKLVVEQRVDIDSAAMRERLDVCALQVRQESESALLCILRTQVAVLSETEAKGIQGACAIDSGLSGPHRRRAQKG